MEHSAILDQESIRTTDGASHMDGLIAALQRKTRETRELRQSRADIIQADERLRTSVSRLLEGSVQARLLAASQKLRKILDLPEGDRHNYRRLIEEVEREIDSLRKEDLNEASGLLHPWAIGLGLVPALRTLARQLGDKPEIKVLADEGMQGLDEPANNESLMDLKLDVYRVIEEAIRNARLHGRARHIYVLLEVSAAALHVTVRDDGKGFDERQVKHGIGLRSIAARVANLDGIWEITSTPGKGTRVDASIPLQDSKVSFHAVA